MSFGVGTMEMTTALSLILGLVAFLLLGRTRKRVTDLETTVMEFSIAAARLRNENQHLRNRMHIQKARMKQVEMEVFSWRRALESCAREHFDLSDQLHNLTAQAPYTPHTED